MATEIVRRRRHYSVELKQQVLLECAQPGASVAKVAMAQGINANIVHGWRKLAREANLPMLPAPQFVPVVVSPAETTSAQERQVALQLRRGPLVIELSWPITDTAGLGHWLRELLR
mgnify:FL=1